MADPKDNQNTPSSNQNKGSGSDTASAAKISAGTSMGSVDRSPPTPQSQGSAGTPAPGSSAQSSTLASQTSKPLGGQSTAGTEQQPSSMPGQGGASMGAGQQQRGSSPAQGAQSSGRDQHGSSQSGPTQGGQGQSRGASESARQTAEQAKERASQAYDEATEWMRDTYESASSWASDAMERGGRSLSNRSFEDARRGVQQYVAQNPVMVGLVGLAAGLLLGALLPRTRREDEMIGEWADEVRQQGLRYAHEMTQRGREFVEEGFSGEDPRFSKHESEFGPGPGADRSGSGVNRH
jgi:ElaB/YqjD/DUF883 family membrane-anchored ribosome-binding protein